MDPNNAQQPNVQPVQQAVTEPVQQPAMPEAAPKSKNRKGIILIVILLLLVLGTGFYVLFAKRELNTTQKTSTDNTSIVVPTVPTVTPATAEQVNVETPDANLDSIEKDIQGL